MTFQQKRWEFLMTHDQVNEAVSLVDTIVSIMNGNSPLK